MISSLCSTGQACLTLDENLQKLHESLFKLSHGGLEASTKDSSFSSSSSSDFTGLHGYGGLSAYNTSRAGCVFSNGELISLPSTPSFEHDMSLFRDEGVNIARQVYNSIEEHLCLPPNYFEATYGDLASSAQWHIKKYNLGGAGIAGIRGAGILLPTHTDPSLISVVLHDTPPTNSPNGLQFLDHSAPEQHTWRDVSSFGHGRATVFIGSLMERITGGEFKACRHRVTSTGDEVSPEGRVAATFFFRPLGSRVLVVPPSPLLDGVTVKQISFRNWVARTAKNYERAKLKESEKKNKKNKKNKNKKKEKENKNKDEDSNIPKPTQTQTPTPQPKTQTPSISKHVTAPCGTSTQLIGHAIPGQEKYLGGDTGEDGNIYAIPGCASHVLRINPKTGATDQIGPKLLGEFKWLRSVKAVDGAGNECIYGLPCHASSVLKIVPATGAITTFGELGDRKWKYHGGNFANGKIWCIPQKATSVLVIDPLTDTVEFVGGGGPDSASDSASDSNSNSDLEGECKWYGGLMGNDGCVYGMPQNADGVLKIDPFKATVEVVKHPLITKGGNKWHGGLRDKEGNIWAVPANADSFLKVVPGENVVIEIFGKGDFCSGQHRQDGKYKFLGGVCGVDGNLFMIPSDSDFVVMVDPRTNEIRNIGPSLKDELYIQNKWQNGFSAADGTIYAVPLKGSNVLCVRPQKLVPGGGGTEGRLEPEVTLIGGPFLGMNKWEGGVLGPDGACYCMPNNYHRVLRISPPGAPILKATDTPFTAVLRSSNHTVGYSKARKTDEGPLGGPLPSIFYDCNHKIEIGNRAKTIIAAATALLLGSTTTKSIESGLESLVLVDDCVTKNGNSERQMELSEAVANDETFLAGERAK